MHKPSALLGGEVFLWYIIGSMKGLIAAAILLALPLVQGVKPLQKDDKTHAANHQSDTRDNKGTPENGPSEGQGKPLNSISHIECKCSGQNPPDYKTAGFWVNFVLAIGTVVIAAFSVIMGNASRKAAVVAEKTLKLMSADVHIEAISLIPPSKITPRSFIAVRLRNSGETRAEKVRSYIKITIPGVPDSEFSPETFTISKGAEQLVRFLEFHEFLTRQTFEQILNGTLAVKISGTVTYIDVFGDSHTLEVKEGILDPERGVFNIGRD